MRRNVTQEFIDQFRNPPHISELKTSKYNIHDLKISKCSINLIYTWNASRKIKESNFNLARIEKEKRKVARLRFAIRHTCSNTFSRGYLAETRRKWNEPALQMCTLYLPRRNDIGGGRAASAHGDTRVAIMSGPTSTCRPSSDAYLHRAHLDFPR